MTAARVLNPAGTDAQSERSRCSISRGILIKTGNESIWKREKRLFWKNGAAEPVQPVERRKVESQSWIRKRKKTLLQRISVCAWRTTT